MVISIVAPSHVLFKSKKKKIEEKSKKQSLNSWNLWPFFLLLAYGRWTIETCIVLRFLGM